MTDESYVQFLNNELPRRINKREAEMEAKRVEAEMAEKKAEELRYQRMIESMEL